MKDSSTLAGVYGASSRVSSFPHPKEVYVEQLCSLDAQGGVIDRVPGSSGALISMDECNFVELVELPTAQLRPLIQRSNLWQKIHGQIKTATLMRLSGRFSNQQSSVNSTVHLSNQPQMLSPSTTRVPTSQVQVPTAQQDQLPNQHQQLIQGSPVQAQPAPPPP